MDEYINNQNDDGDDDDLDMKQEFTFEETMQLMEQLEATFKESSKVVFFVNNEILDVKGNGTPSFAVYKDTSFGFNF